MADNTTLNTGSGGDTIRDKDRSGVKTQIVALDLNPAGTETLMAGAMPVTGTFYQTTQPVSQSGMWNVGITGTPNVAISSGSVSITSGTVTANIGTSGSLALDATLTGGTQKSKLVDSAGTNVATVSAGGALKVDGSAVTQPVSGTFWQATQPVSGTFWQATQPVSGTFWQATQPISGTVTATTPLIAAATLADATANPTVTIVGDCVQVFNGTTWDRWRGQVAQRVDSLWSGTTALTPLYAPINISASGDNTIVAAVGGKKITVLAYRFQSAATVNVYFRDGTGGTALTGAMTTGGAGGGGGAGFCPVGHFQGSVNTLLAINLSGAVQVSGHLVYVTV